MILSVSVSMAIEVLFLKKSWENNFCLLLLPVQSSTVKQNFHLPKFVGGAQDHFDVSFIKIHPVLISQDGKTLLPQNYDMDYSRSKS